MTPIVQQLSVRWFPRSIGGDLREQRIAEYPDFTPQPRVRLYSREQPFNKMDQRSTDAERQRRRGSRLINGHISNPHIWLAAAGAP